VHAHAHDVPDAAITEDLSGVSPKCRTGAVVEYRALIPNRLSRTTIHADRLEISTVLAWDSFVT
jgi:hypothetical protein